jgi:hypothetical protein
VPLETSPPLQVEGYDGDAASLREALGSLAAQRPTEPLVVVAPYFTLREAALHTLEVPGELLQFANNFTAQGHKLKGCKPLLNRTVCRLLHLDPRALESFPLMRHRDGIWVADLGLLPEKYRLDPGRCEEVLKRALEAWLDTVERRLLAAQGAGR